MFQFNTQTFKKVMISCFVLISIATWSGFWVYGKHYKATDNAYVNANVVQIAARINGQISKMLVVNNQYVKKDQPLFEIDNQPFQLALQKAKAEVAIGTTKLHHAEQTAYRISTLVKKKFLSPQEGDNIITTVETAKASLALAEVNLNKAVLNLHYTQVTAPTNGWVTNLSLRDGNMVTTNQPLFALISDKEFWVDANFKETAMENIKPGQLATIKVDMYPDHRFLGVVDSISGGTGNVFSLLPPQNATGNWVKVTQRIPVRIRVLSLNSNYPLRIGSSASVSIQLKSGSK